MHYFTPAAPPQADIQPTPADWLDYEAWLDTLPPGWPDEADGPAPSPDTEGYGAWLDTIRADAFADGAAAGYDAAVRRYEVWAAFESRAEMGVAR